MSAGAYAGLRTCAHPSSLSLRPHTRTRAHTNTNLLLTNPTAGFRTFPVCRCVVFLFHYIIRICWEILRKIPKIVPYKYVHMYKEI